VGSLLKQHGKEWLGALAPVARHPRWERGFLVQCELAQNSAADKATWEEAAQATALHTVRRLVRGRANAHLYTTFVVSPAARSLVDIEAPNGAFLDEIVAHPIAARLTRLRVAFLHSTTLRKLAPPAFPSLRTLQLPVTPAEALEVATTVAKSRSSLERLDLALHDGDPRGWPSESASILRAIFDRTSLAAATVTLFGAATVGARRDGARLVPIVEDVPGPYGLEAADRLLDALGLKRDSVGA
jgi:hypothetical protein